MKNLSLPATASTRRIARLFLGLDPWACPSTAWTERKLQGLRIENEYLPLALGAGFAIGKLRLAELLSGKTVDSSASVVLSKFAYGEPHWVLSLNADDLSFGDEVYRQGCRDDDIAEVDLPPLVRGVTDLTDEAEVLFAALCQLDPELQK